MHFELGLTYYIRQNTDYIKMASKYVVKVIHYSRIKIVDMTYLVMSLTREFVTLTVIKIWQF